MNKKIIIIAVAVVLITTAVLFFRPKPEQLEVVQEPEMQGTVLSIENNEILVAEGGTLDNLEGQAFWFKIDAKTEIDSQEEIEVGDLVSVWSTGFVLETYPAQASAAKIVVLEKRKKIGLANPASVYCTEEEGIIEIRKDSQGNEKGYCLFSDGSECEEWQFFQEECSKGENFCQDLCGDGICQEIVCMAVGCPCSETPETCPQDCSI